jgi:hypothetical protein
MESRQLTAEEIAAMIPLSAKRAEELRQRALTTPSKDSLTVEEFLNLLKSDDLSDANDQATYKK